MNERLKDLIEQAGLSALLGNNWLYGEHLERFAELVLQNYASQIMTTEERERFIRDDEREACANLSDEHDDDVGMAISRAIRERGEK